MQNKLILVAENDSDDQFFFSTALKEYSSCLVPLFFPNGEELMLFLDHSDNQNPIAIFLDLNMPRMGGIEVLQEIRQRDKYAHVPVVMISTSANPAEINRCRSIGAVDYLVKPNTFSQLSASIRTVLSYIENI